ncbi:EamA family transporter [Patescibacteria group bacterium]|nr:EamA family transporter [Patescibacteria group bacterium]
MCTITQFGGLYFHVPVAVIVLLLYTQPLWTIVFGRLFFRERIKRYHLIACVLVLA